MSRSSASQASTTIELRSLKVVGPYRLELSFSDGSMGIHDFSELASRPGPMTEPFADPAFFGRAFVEDGVLTWPNGYDWDSPALHARVVAAGELIRPVAAE